MFSKITQALNISDEHVRSITKRNIVLIDNRGLTADDMKLIPDAIMIAKQSGVSA